MVGSENSVDMCRYAIVVTRTEEGLDNELTGGWKVIEVSEEAGWWADESL